MRRLLLLACAIVFVDTAFYAAITPLLPHFEDEFGLSKSAAGVLVAAYPAGTLAGAIPGGYLAAKAGVRATVLLGLSLMVVSSIAFAFADSLAVLDSARFVQGVGGAASWAGAMAWVASAAPRDRRGEMIGTAMGAAVALRSARSPTLPGSRRRSPASPWSAPRWRSGRCARRRRRQRERLPRASCSPRCSTGASPAASG
jgi:MFS family permease